MLLGWFSHRCVSQLLHHGRQDYIEALMRGYLDTYLGIGAFLMLVVVAAAS